MNAYIRTSFSMLLLLPLAGLQAQNNVPQLAIAENTSFDTYEKVKQIEDPALQAMMMSAIMPGYGNSTWDLENLPEEEQNDFFKAYQEYPLDMRERIENVEYVLNNADDIATLGPEDLEYKDIVFGEAVIPIPDRRVRAIANQNFLLEYGQTLEEEKQAALQASVSEGGTSLQEIEDIYATKLRTLLVTENKFKDVKLKYVNLENQLKQGRITQDEFNEEVRILVAEFEDFTRLGGEAALFNEQSLRAVTEKIYEPLVLNTGDVPDSGVDKGTLVQWLYRLGALLLLVLAVSLLLWSLKRRRKS